MKSIFLKALILVMLCFFTIPWTSYDFFYSSDRDVNSLPTEATVLKPEQELTKAKSTHLHIAHADGKTIIVPILMYHHVGSIPQNSDALRQDLTVSTEDFAHQVAWLSSQGYTAVRLEDISNALHGLNTLPKKPVAFTFDDGYDDVFLNAIPILKEHGYVGSFGVVPSFFGTVGYASWQQVAAATKDGMGMVSHTENHFDGSSSKYNPAYIRQNVESSLAELAAHGIATHILIYPYGHYRPDYIAILKDMGFTMALTTKFGKHLPVESPYEVPRVRVHGNESLDTFKKIILE